MQVNYRRVVSGCFVFAVAFLSYLSSLDGGFVFDDHRGILTNDDLDSGKTSLVDVFKDDFWGGAMTRKESHKSYRPFTVLSYRYLNYHFNGLEPYSYHLVNVCMHSVAAMLFYMLCEMFLQTCPANHCPMFAALLFAVHSVHTEAVASIVGRAEVLSCIFFLLALFAYIKSVSHKHGPLQKPLPQTKWHYLLLCLLFTVGSLLSKEQGVTVLGVCGGYDILLNWDACWSVLGAEFRNKRKRKVSGEGEIKAACPIQPSENGELPTVSNGEASTRETERHTNKSNHSANDGENKDNSGSRNRHTAAAVALRLGVLGVSGVALLWFRLSMNHGSEPIFKPQELKASYHEDRSVRALSLSNIHSINTWLLLSPSTLCCDWSLRSVPLVTTVSDGRNIYSLLHYAGLIALIIQILKSKRDRLPVGMGLMLLLIPFLPASGLVFRVGFVIAERVLYVPSLGSCLLVAVGAKRLSSAKPRVHKLFVNILCVCLLVTMAAKTHLRNKDWQSDYSLFESGVAVMPSNVKLRNNYGMELKAVGRVAEAVAQYKAAMEIDPDYGEVYFNYGNLLSDEEDFKAAATNFEKAITFPQMYGRTLNNLATMYLRLGRLKEAEVNYLESLQLNSDQATTYNNLASLYGEAKRHRESEKMFKKAIELNPTYIEAQFNLGTLYIQMGLWEDGERELKRALELNPNHYGARNNLKVARHYKEKMKRENRR